jgi:hypothetical protein
MEDFMRRSSSIAAALLMTTLVQFGCKAGHPGLAANERFIRQSDDPKEWPFNVPEGVLSCGGNPKSPGLAAVTFTANGITYGINGGALSGDVYPSADPITPRTTVGLYKGNYGKYLDDGLDICSKFDPALWGRFKRQQAPSVNTIPEEVRPQDTASLHAPPITSAKTLPSNPSLGINAKLSKTGMVEVTVTTNLPTPLAAMVSLSLQGQKDHDTAIGTSQHVTLTGQTTTFSIKAVNNDDGMDGKALPKGDYDADVIVGPRWDENKIIASLPKNLEAKRTIALFSGPARASVEHRNKLQTWVMENVPADAPWDESRFKAKLGSYQKSVSTRSPLVDAYYFPEADMTLIVSRVSRVVLIWRAGNATQ